MLIVVERERGFGVREGSDQSIMRHSGGKGKWIVDQGPNPECAGLGAGGSVRFGIESGRRKGVWEKRVERYYGRAGPRGASATASVVGSLNPKGMEGQDLERANGVRGVETLNSL